MGIDTTAIDYGLILSAGLGTRMGVIGQALPKVLWPIFEKTIIELQILYLKKLGINKIFINLHFLPKDIEQFVRSHFPEDNITFLFEPTLLDVGGAIHNLAKRSEVSYRGRLLVVNGDQFFCFDPSYYEKMFALSKMATAVLLALPFRGNEYNALQYDKNNLLQGILKAQTLKPQVPYWTYSGVSCIVLDRLKEVEGKSSFFESVASFNDKSYVLPVSGGEYWDFGTKSRYFYSLFSMMDFMKRDEEGLFLTFCWENGVFNNEKLFLDSLSYGLKPYPHCLDFSKKEKNYAFKQQKPRIILESFDHQNDQGTLFWKSYADELS